MCILHITAIDPITAEVATQERALAGERRQALRAQAGREEHSDAFYKVGRALLTAAPTKIGSLKNQSVYKKMTYTVERARDKPITRQVGSDIDAIVALHNGFRHTKDHNHLIAEDWERMRMAKGYRVVESEDSDIHLDEIGGGGRYMIRMNQERIINPFIVTRRA